MAHRGKYYPINQQLRLYWADDNWVYPIPSVSYLEATGLTDGISAPVNVAGVEASLVDFTIGDYLVTYKSAPFDFNAKAVQLGWQIEISTVTGLRSRWVQMWADDVEQLLRNNATGVTNNWAACGLGSPGVWAVPGATMRILFALDQTPKLWADF